jgi:hypothetical protein
MKSLPVSLFPLEVGARWTARVLTVLLVGLVAGPVIINGGYDIVHGFYEGGVPHAFRVKGVEPLQMLLFWTACLGLVLAWRWPVLGGAAALGGMLLFFAVAFAVQGGFPGGLLPYLMLLPGVLFLLSAFVRRRRYAKAWALFGPG